jgi:4-amino-4-deoxy-L-arabinose transferase-like glycosyltransferase
MPSGDLPSRLAPAAVVLPLLLLGIFDHELWTPDEPRAAEIAREFLEPGHSWAVPTLNGDPFLEKPPLVYWTAAASMKLFGVHAWAARLPCLLFALGTLAFTGLLARSLFDEAAGLGAVLILATTSGFLLVSHHLESDAGLVCFTAGAAYFLHRALSGSRAGFPAFHACLLGGFFSKGLLALVFAGLLFGAWLAWTRSWKTLLRPSLWLGLPILVAPAALWLAILAREPRLFRTFVVENHLDRFSGTAVHLGHFQPWYYYAIQFPAQSAPWIAVFALLLPRLWRGRSDPRIRFLASWLVPGLLFLSAAATKRGIYTIPLLPPLAILTAHGVAEAGKARWIPRAAGVLAALTAVAALVAIPRVEPRKTLRPFGEAVASRASAGARVCALDPDETTRAVIPFYTGRHVEPVSLAQLDGLSRSDAPVALVVGPRPPAPEEEAAIQRSFPTLAWESPADHSRRMRIYTRTR